MKRVQESIEDGTKFLEKEGDYYLAITDSGFLRVFFLLLLFT